MNSLGIIAVINAKQEFKKDVFNILHTVADASRKEEGNISYIVYEDIKNSSKFILLEEWKSQNDIDFHNQTKHFLSFKKELEGKIENLSIDIIREIY